MGHPKSHAMCLPQTISDFPEGQFQILIWTVASEQPFGVRTFPKLARPWLPERPWKRFIHVNERSESLGFLQHRAAL